MKLDAGDDTLQSVVGSITTIFFAAILIFYMMVKINTIHAGTDIDIFGVLLDNKITTLDKFDSSQGLYIAAALTPYDGT